MTFDDIANGTHVFLDANTFIDYFTAHKSFGPACKSLLERIDRQEIQGHTSTQVLGEVAHRLMTFEACNVFGWSVQGIANRLRRHPSEIQKLKYFRTALDEISLLNVRVLPVFAPLVFLAADISQQHGLLSNDALVVAVMRDQGLTHLASNDGDFDRVPGLTRYAPV